MEKRKNEKLRKENEKKRVKRSQIKHCNKGNYNHNRNKGKDKCKINIL